VGREGLGVAAGKGRLGGGKVSDLRFWEGEGEKGKAGGGGRVGGWKGRLEGGGGCWEGKA